MQLVDGRVTNYRSINDSGIVTFDPEITNIVGVTGSGKTSFLKMLSGVSSKVRFGEVDLPHESDVLARFHDGKVQAGEIIQLRATFKVEAADRARLPPRCRKANLIEVIRTLAGGITLSVDGEALPRADVRREANVILASASKVAEALHSLDSDDPKNGAIIGQAVDEVISNFREADFYDRNGIMLAVQALRSIVNSAEIGRETLIPIEGELDRMDAARREIARKIRADPLSAVHRIMPKPRYCDNVFELDDWIDLDRFIADPFASKTFACVAQICGLTPVGMSKARNAAPAQRDGYLSTKSSILSSRLNQFWRQENYTFRLAIDGNRLLLHVADRTTGTFTSLTERSDGFRWWMAFFLDLSAFLARKSGRSVILLDNPATELHEKGKGDVLRFIQEAAKSDRIQIIYSTHERALVDPWRTDRIRVADLQPDGTKIKTVTAASSNGMLETVMKSIGSPARYSLFGAPRTIVFEGASDMYTVSAVNEYMTKTDPDASLDGDVYSINSMSGITKARYVLSMYKNLDLDFTIVVDRGEESTEVAKRVGAEEFERRFVEIPAARGNAEADIEDLVDRTLYYEAFKEAYKGILDRMPSIDEIDADGRQKRSDNYRRWFKSSGESYSKTLVAHRMFGVMINGESARNDPDRAGALERTGRAFAGLFAAIKAKYGDAAALDAPHAAP